MGHVMPLRDSRARAERAFQLRAIGRSWRQVAAELGYRSVGAAQNAVARHEHREAAEPRETSRRSLVESARITHSVLFDRFAVAVDREDDATVALLSRELVRNRDQLAKLLGAYAPERAEISHGMRGLDAAAFIEAIRTRALALVEVNAAERHRLAAAIDAEVIG